jgi:hypothetical protein
MQTASDTSPEAHFREMLAPGEMLRFVLRPSGATRKIGYMIEGASKPGEEAKFAERLRLLLKRTQDSGLTLQRRSDEVLPADLTWHQIRPQSIEITSQGRSRLLGFASYGSMNSPPDASSPLILPDLSTMLDPMTNAALLPLIRESSGIERIEIEFQNSLNRRFSLKSRRKQFSRRFS